MAEAIGLAAFMDVAGVTCTQRLGDLVAHLCVPPEAVRRRPARRTSVGETELTRIEALLDEPGLAAADRRPRSSPPPRGAAASVAACAPCSSACSVVCLEGHQNAYLSGVHAVLVGLNDADKWRLGVRVAWKGGPHELSYRQIEYTAHLLERALKKERSRRCTLGSPSRRSATDCSKRASPRPTRTPRAPTPSTGPTSRASAPAE